MITEALRRILTKRQAYRRVFNLEDRDARQVLADLRRFCGAERAAYRVSPITRQVDPNATFIAVGRLEVYQRISAFLNINDADLLKLQEHHTEEDRKND
jgi:hypothetical protein